MKKIALALLLGLGMMVGCGEEPKKPTGTAKPADAAKKDTGAPAAPAAPKADETKKDTGAAPAAPAPKADETKKDK